MNICATYLRRLGALSGGKGGTKTLSLTACRSLHEGDSKLPTTEKDNKKDVTAEKAQSDDKEKGVAKDNSQEVRIGKHFSGFADRDPSDVFTESPETRAKRILMFDYIRKKEKVMTYLGFEFESQLDNYYFGPSAVDVVIIGGGATGSSCAYWIKEKIRDGLSVAVIEKDFSCKHTSTGFNVDGLHQRSSVPENVEMSLFGDEFMRNIGHYLKVDDLPTPQVNFQPYGYLVLATEEEAEQLTEDSEMQNSLGARNVLLNPSQLKARFPWLKTDGISLGCLGLEKEGWFDQWGLMFALKSKAISRGAEYVSGEVVGFRFHKPEQTYMDDRFRTVRSVVVKIKNGMYKTIDFCYCVLAAGSESGIIGNLAGLGYGCDILQHPLPIERRKRYLYCFHSPNGPGLNTPLTLDSNGLHFRREGYGGYYITEFSPDNKEDGNELNMDENYFNEKIRPKLAERVSGFENVRVHSSWGGFYGYNAADGSGIIGPHPLFQNLLFACGFDRNSIQHAPAVGRAISELIINNKYLTIDLSRLEFGRIPRQTYLVENSFV